MYIYIVFLAVISFFLNFAPLFASDFFSANFMRHGANYFNSVPHCEDFYSAKSAGIEFMRIAPNKWRVKRDNFNLGDFLIKNSKSYVSKNTKIHPQDIKYLNQILTCADKAQIKVILTMLSLPHNRWRQHNNGVQQRDIWKKTSYQKQAMQVWLQLIPKIKHHSSIVAYNIKNEPSPERVKLNLLNDWTEITNYQKWQKKVQNTPQDLNKFYSNAVKQIRSVDKKHYIVLDSGYYATPAAFSVLQPINDKHILYSFHMYIPFAYTNFKININNKYSYPGKIPFGEKFSQFAYWDKAQIHNFLKVITNWQTKHKVPSNQILVGEFGVNRSFNGAEQYLHDLIHEFNNNKWHWAFYSYREDSWQAMDYELGNKKALGAQYWKDINNQKVPISTYNKHSPCKTPVWKAIYTELGNLCN